MRQNASKKIETARKSLVNSVLNSNSSGILDPREALEGRREARKSKT